MTTQLAPEKLEVLSQCVEDGWPLIQIERTHNVRYRVMRRYFPDYKGMDLTEAAKLGALARRTTLALRRGL